MLLSKFQNIKIAGMSVAVPSEKIPVESFIETFGEEFIKKFSERSKVKTVHRAKPNQTASDLGYEAANNLMKNSGINLNDIGVLLFVTQKPDYRVPSSAFVIHKRLELSNECSCMDLNLACSGYIYGLHSVFSMLNKSDSKYALIITGDTSTRTISPFDRTMIMLFGDSGTATFVQKTDQEVPSYFSMRTDGRRFKSIITPAGAYRNMNAPKERVKWGDGIERSDYDTHMKGMDVFGFSIIDVPKLMREFMATLNTTPETYDCFALHQANMDIIKQISRKLKLPNDKTPIALDRFGNNSSNSIPLVLADKFGSTSNEIIRTFMCGFGGGLSWACGDIGIETNNIYPIIYTDEYFDDN